MPNTEELKELQSQVDRNTNILVDVGVLKNQVATLGQLCNKMDIVIEKLMAQTERSIERIYDDMGEREKEQDKANAEVHDRIDKVLEKFEESERRITEIVRNEISALRKDLVDNDRSNRPFLPEKFKEWKYMLLGGLVVIGWLLDHINYDTVKKLFGW